MKEIKAIDERRAIARSRVGRLNSLKLLVLPKLDLKVQHNLNQNPTKLFGEY